MGDQPKTRTYKPSPALSAARAVNRIKTRLRHAEEMHVNAKAKVLKYEKDIETARADLTEAYQHLLDVSGLDNGDATP